MNKKAVLLIIIAFYLLSNTQPAFAYVGPGAGLSLVGSLLGVLAALFLALWAILSWPIRRLLKKRKEKAAESTNQCGADENTGNNRE